MQVIIQPSHITGEIQAPSSKSSMQRACAAALVRKGTTLIKSPGFANDDKAALRVIQGLGATVETTDDGSLKIFSNGVKPVTKSINCGESGLGIRMFAPLVALSEKSIAIEGEGSLLGRPMDFFDEVLPKLGVSITSNKGKLPLHVKGPLIPRDIEIDGSMSSQFLTGLLMAYAASGADQVSIKVLGLKSKPYIDLTLQVMEHFGWRVENQNYESFYFKQHPSIADLPSSVYYTVEGDWSGGAFLLVAGAIAGKIKVRGLDLQSTQADKSILEALKDCGADLVLGKEKIVVGPASLQGFHFDATDCPDLFPPLVALAAYCKEDSIIKGVGRLTHKESNRALTLQEEFGKMGVEIELKEDHMTVKGGSIVKGGHTFSHHDHRIAMACGVAALMAHGETYIEDAGAINKSYPDFFTDIQSLGAQVREMQDALKIK